MFKKIIVAGVALGAAAALVAAPAQADPAGGQFRELAGMGSDTTFDLMNKVSEVVVIGGNKVIASYNPTPAGEVINTKDESVAGGRCNTAGGSGGVARADGSGAGRAALTAAMTVGSATEGCLQFARSSSSTVDAGQTFVATAKDGLTYAFINGTGVSKTLSLATLKGIYACQAGPTWNVYVPQAGSGSRKDWLSYMGVSEPLAADTCIKDTKADGTPIQENNARFMTGKSIMPFSVGSWIAQSVSSTDNRGAALLGAIGGVTPLGQNLSSGKATDGSQGKLRTVGNILPTAKLVPGTLEYQTFVNDGSGKSAICTQAESTIANAGFAPVC